MKTKLVLFLTLVLTLSISSSCENDNKTTSNELSSNKLNQTLKKFNNNFNYQEMNPSFLENKKDWWETLGEVCAIATADAGGAAVGVAGVQVVAGVVGAATAGTGYAVVATVGGVVGAYGGSYAAYAAFHPKRGTFNNIGPKGTSVIYNLPEEYSHLNNFGLLHNNGLENVYFSGANCQTDLQWMSQNISNINDIDYVTLYNSIEFQNLINNIKSSSIRFSESNYSYTVLLNDYKNKKLMNETVSSVLSNFFEAANRAVVYEDVKQINDFYVSSIVNSNLNTKDKEAILASLTVYIQSYYYWYNFQIEE